MYIVSLLYLLGDWFKRHSIKIYRLLSHLLCLKHRFIDSGLYIS
jgi:hypothetical protein